MVSEEQIINQFEAAQEKFPKLNRHLKVGEVWEIEGAIDVIDDEGSYWDTYDVKIIVPKNYPDALFVMQETSGKIPKEADWHNSNSCCVSTEAVIYSTLGDDLSLLNWIVKFAHPFLANHIVKMKTKEYASGEFAHFTRGIIQGYEKLFGLEGQKAVVAKLASLCSILQKGRNDKCFCGSGKKIKHCYLLTPFTHKFSNVPYTILKRDLEEINSNKNS